MIPSEVNKMFDDVIRQWRAADSQRTIFGVNMLQTKKAITELTESLKKVFEMFPSFSLIKKDQAMVIVVQSDDAGSESAEASIPANIPSLPKVFTELNIDSITVQSGVTEEELKELFAAISMKGSEIKDHGGLSGILKEKNVTHLAVDQMQFKLLKDGEAVGDTGKGKGKGAGKGDGESPEKRKKRESTWFAYLTGKLDKKTLTEEHKDDVDAVIADPKQIEKTLKSLIAKQTEAEKFLAQLEQKLFDAGFPPEAVEALKKKLLKPKKVSIEEDELARLRKIEEEFLKDADQRADSTLETINAIKQKLSDETARSEAIMHQMGQGGVVLDKDGRIVSVNATAQKILGLSEEDIRGKSMNDILKSHHVMTTVSDWQGETDTHTPKEVHMQAQDDETLAIIRESSIIIESESGRSIGVVSALQDVTQKEDLNRRKNDILDVLGHDLRAPLGAIKQNFAVLAQTTKLDVEGSEHQKKFLKNCENSIERMSKLIEKILDTRQLEAGKIMLKYDTIETNSLLEQAVTAQNEWAGNKNITLKIDAPALPNIEADPERLYQVITNLISNALKFTPEGGAITARANTVTVDGREHIEIAVTDTGMGIEKENLEKIFDKYQQVIASAPKGVRGLGLGLSICKAIVELHGGRIRVDSEPGKGSTFTVQVPVQA